MGSTASSMATCITLVFFLLFSEQYKLIRNEAKREKGAEKKGGVKLLVN